MHTRCIRPAMSICILCSVGSLSRSLEGSTNTNVIAWTTIQVAVNTNGVIVSPTNGPAWFRTANAIPGTNDTAGLQAWVDALSVTQSQTRIIVNSLSDTQAGITATITPMPGQISALESMQGYLLSTQGGLRTAVDALVAAGTNWTGTVAGVAAEIITNQAAQGASAFARTDLGSNISSGEVDAATFPAGVFDEQIGPDRLPAGLRPLSTNGAIVRAGANVTVQTNAPNDYTISGSAGSGGDFMADGSVRMSGNLDYGANSATNLSGLQFALESPVIVGAMTIRNEGETNVVHYTPHHFGGNNLYGLGTGGVYATMKAAWESAAGDQTLATSANARSLVNRDRITFAEVRYMVDNAMTAHAMPYSWFDEFEDQTGINATTSTGETYDADGDWYGDDYSATEGSGSGATLAAQWKMNDNAATTNIAENVGSRNGGIVDGVTSSSMTMTGKTSSALYFDEGSTEYAVVNKDDLFTPGTNDFSVSVWTWVDAESSYSQAAVSWGVSGSPNWLLAPVWGDPGPPCFSVLGAGDCSVYTGDNLSEQAWHHLVGVRRGEKVELWVDGQLRGTDTDPIQDLTAAASSRLAIGSYISPPNGVMRGAIDNLMYFNTALTGAEVTNLWNGGAGTEAWSGGGAGSTNGDVGFLLCSTNVSAVSTPASTHVVVWLEPEETYGTFAGINTGASVYVSANAGTNWSRCLLSRDTGMDLPSDLSTAQAYSGATNVSGGNKMAVKLWATNSRVHAWSQLWED